MSKLSLYEKPNRKYWHGRIDNPNDLDSYRWHQLIQLLDLERNIKKAEQLSFCFLGYKSDEGVKRNLGRTGAKNGANSIRSQLSNLPSYFDNDVNLYDAGNILGSENLEESQNELALAVEKILDAGMFPILLGGGHEIALGHYMGIHKFLKKNKQASPAIINIDAHFDMRPYINGSTSGTMFHQIADFNISNQKKFNYLVLGIQQSENTRSLFKRIENLGGKYVLARDVNKKTLPSIQKKITNFINKKSVYLTICSDVFNAAVAPGVSSPQPFGMYPETVLQMVKHIVKSKHLISFDIAEVSPRFDDDAQTAKLASIIIFAVLNTLYNPERNLILI